MVKKIPEGYHSITPYLIVDDGAAAIDFYKRAFGAVEETRLGGPDGKVGHAELKIGDSHLMLADETPQSGPSAKSLGGSAVNLLIYTEDCDAMIDRAVKAGAQVVRPPQDQFYGDRAGRVADPFGLVWDIHTHIEDVSPDEMSRRAAAAAQS